MKLLLLLSLVGCAHRKPRDPVDAAAEARVFYYRDNEGLQVVTTGVHGEQPLPHGDSLGVTWILDHVQIQPVDAVSRASAKVGNGLGIDKNRHEIDLSYAADARPVLLAGRARLSVEPDFLSVSGELRASGEVNRGNTLISGALGYGHDDIHPESFHPDDAGRWPASSDRVTLAASLRQLLARRADFSAGLGVGVQSGALSSPYRRALVLSGVGVFASYHEQAERHPDLRTRVTGFAGVGGYLGRGIALHVRVAGYADSWSVLALTPELAAVFELGPRALLRLGYRYYVQSSADFYQPKYRALETIRSGDRRLGALDEHLPGVELRVTLLGESGRPPSMEAVAGYSLSILRYWEIDTTVTAHLASLGINFVY